MLVVGDQMVPCNIVKHILGDLQPEKSDLFRRKRKIILSFLEALHVA